MKITPVLVVPSIESVLPLYDALGFERTAEVPHGDVLGFVILKNGNAELMLQTIDSVRADAASVLEGPVPIRAASLFVEVESLDDAVKRLPPGTDVFVERRSTFYGATETFLRDAAGNVIVLAQF
jgi:hypothetical protein